MNTLPENEVILPKVRLSYPEIFKMKQEVNKDGSKKGDPFNQATFILDTGLHAKTIKEIEAAIIVAKKMKWNGKTPVVTHKGLRDGIEKENDGFGEGTMFMGCKNYGGQYPLQLVGHNVNTPVTEEQNLFYGGCYVNAHIRVAGYEYEGVKGITTKVISIQYHSKGEPFGEASTPADEVFSNIEDADKPDPMD